MNNMQIQEKIKIEYKLTYNLPNHGKLHLKVKVSSSSFQNQIPPSQHPWDPKIHK